MIVGVTKSKDGELLQRLPITTKLAIGRPPDANHNHPQKLDYFIFLCKVQQGKEVLWVQDTELTTLYGEKPKEVDIILVSDDIDGAIFPHTLAWWTRTERKCWGDGVEATRRTPENRRGVKWSPCAEAGCKDFERGDCKPSGDLYFVLAERPRLGELCRVHTSSYRSVKQIFSSLAQAYEMFGRLSGIKMTLKVSPETVRFDTDTTSPKKSTAYILSLSVHGDSFQKALAGASADAIEMQKAKKLLSVGEITGEEPEEERAAEISTEFVDTVEVKEEPQPTTNQQQSATPGSAVPAATVLAQVQSTEPQPQIITFTGVIKAIRTATRSSRKMDFFQLVDSDKIFASPNPMPYKEGDSIGFKCVEHTDDHYFECTEVWRAVSTPAPEVKTQPSVASLFYDI